jgi:hypothetical protein
MKIGIMVNKFSVVDCNLTPCPYSSAASPLGKGAFLNPDLVLHQATQNYNKNGVFAVSFTKIDVIRKTYILDNCP